MISTLMTEYETDRINSCIDRIVGRFYNNKHEEVEEPSKKLTINLTRSRLKEDVREGEQKSKFNGTLQGIEDKNNYRL